MRETGSARVLDEGVATPLLGQHAGVALFLLFNGILGDRRPEASNVLTGAVLDDLHRQSPLAWDTANKVVYGEACRIGPARLAAEGITFKQLPHAVPK